MIVLKTRTNTLPGFPAITSGAKFALFSCRHQCKLLIVTETCLEGVPDCKLRNHLVHDTTMKWVEKQRQLAYKPQIQKAVSHTPSAVFGKITAPVLPLLQGVRRT